MAWSLILFFPYRSVSVALHVWNSTISCGREDFGLPTPRTLISCGRRRIGWIFLETSSSIPSSGRMMIWVREGIEENPSTTSLGCGFKVCPGGVDYISWMLSNGFMFLFRDVDGVVVGFRGGCPVTSSGILTPAFNRKRHGFLWMCVSVSDTSDHLVVILPRATPGWLIASPVNMNGRNGWQE